MSNVLAFPRIETHRCKTAKEAKEILKPLASGLAKNAQTVKHGKTWVIRIEYWEPCDITQLAVANLSKEVARWQSQ